MYLSIDKSRNRTHRGIYPTDLQSAAIPLGDLVCFTLDEIKNSLTYTKKIENGF